MNNLLKIEKLDVLIEKKKILNNFDFTIGKNEIHILLGPNGSGKSTFLKVLAGHPSYVVEKGKIDFNNKNLLDMSPEIRSHEGLFLAFQSPIEISGVSNYDFLRIAYNEKQKYLKQKELDPLEFMELIQTFLNILKMKGEFLNRNLNEGFSGGEKKRNEILQMLILNPSLILLDEIDSGLDIDAIKIIYQVLAMHRKKDSSLIVVTHNPRILNYLKPTHVHILMNGKIIKSGKTEILEQLELKGYDSFVKKVEFNLPS